jgi:hypothetical protein
MSGLASAAPILSFEGLPSSYTPGDNFSFEVRLANVANLNSFTIGLTLQAELGAPGVDFFFDDALTIPPATRYVFDPGPGVTPFGFLANAGIYGDASTLALSDLLAMGEEVDAMTGLNDLAARIVVTTTRNVGDLTIGFDPSFLELLRDNGDAVPDFDLLVPSPPAIVSVAQTAAVPEPGSLALWAAGLAAVAVLRTRRCIRPTQRRA